MLAVETERGEGAHGADPEQGAASNGYRTATPVVASLAALLAFGLIGLLVALWCFVCGRRRAGLDCATCRRRRHFAFVGTYALAGLVLFGSALAVHQHLEGQGVEGCRAELPARATALLSGSVADTGHASVWSQGRQVLTAPVSGLARWYATDRGGGLCEVGSMTLAFLPSAASHSGVAVGGVVFTGDKSSITAGRWEAMARHESRHVTQWAALTLAGGPLAMPTLYAIDDAFFPHSRNHFERAAGLEDGGYLRPDGVGPRPHRIKVGVIGFVLLAACRGRIRWASRVVASGAAGANARQPGRCPLHSTGWFRLS